MQTALRDVDFSEHISDPREDWREWRQSDRPAYNAVHAMLEIVLVVGLGIRYLCHLVGFAVYHHAKHGERPEFEDDMIQYTNIVEPVLEPEHWHQEALMRGLTFAFGLFVFSLAVATPAAEQFMQYEAITPAMTYWGRMFLATHLLLDPVLGVAWRVATADLRPGVADS